MCTCFVHLRMMGDQLCIGQEVEIFNEDYNKAEMAIIRKFNPTSVAIIRVADRSRWRVPYYWINLEGTDVSIKNTAKKGIEKNALSIGDTVGFRSREGYEVVWRYYTFKSKDSYIKNSTG